MNAVTKIRDLKYAYNEQTSFTYPDFEIKEGEQLLILGKSGVGKSTLLHLLGLLLSPSSGDILMNGENISHLSANKASQFRAKNLGIVFQQHHFIRSTSVESNLLAANYFAGAKQNKERVKLLAESLKIETLLNKKTYELSGGELQRVGIARALMNAPNLVLADEPTANLDDENCHKVFDLLSKTCKINQAALIIVTHDQRLKDIISNQLILQDVS